MKARRIMANVGKRLRLSVRSEDGSSIIELAIIFPALLLLFVACAELGRLVYTYSTLVKATEVGARFLSSNRDAVSADATRVAAARLAAQNLVVYGCQDRTVAPCSTATPIVAGLTPASNVLVTMPASAAAVKYVRVDIQNYTFQPGAFNLSGFTGLASSNFYFSLTPGIQMRYMP